MVLPRFVSMWQEMFEETYEWFHWLFAWKWFHVQDGCFNHTLQYFYNNTTRTDLISVNRSGRARAGDAYYYFNDAYCRPVTSALELWPRRSPHRHGAPSPSFVLRSRALTAASSFVLPPSRWPTPAGRRGHVRTAVLPPRSSHATSVRHWLTWATSFRITILTELPSVHTYFSSSYLRYLKHSTEQLAAVSF